MKRVLVCIALCAVPQDSSGQRLTSSDTSGILTAVLREYRTENGPIVHIARTIACGDTRYTGPARFAQGMSCRGEVIDTAIAAYSRQQNVNVVDVTPPIPVCRWSDEPFVGPVGLRIDLMAPGVIDGEVRAGILARCSAVRCGQPRGFMNSVV